MLARPDGNSSRALRKWVPPPLHEVQLGALRGLQATATESLAGTL